MRLATFADRGYIELVCNNPSVRMWTAFDGAPLCDASKYLRDGSFAVVFEGGCWLAKLVAPCRYVIHTNLLPAVRRSSEALSRQALALAFLQTDAQELLTMIPQTIPHAKLLARRMGFRHLFNRLGVWPADGKRYDIGFYGLSLDDWITRGACSQAGREFHDRLHGELGLESHPDDAVHDAFVGAAVEMIKVGNVGKAVAVYNRWAQFAFYEPISLISENPLRIDIKQCVLQVQGDEFTVERACHA